MIRVNVDCEETEVIFESNKKRKLKNKIISATPLITIAIYLLLGYCLDAWHPGWVVFLAIPLVPTLLNIFGKSFKKSFMSILTIVLVVAYIVVGLCFNIWHPTWVGFFLIPIVSIFIDE